MTTATALLPPALSGPKRAAPTGLGTRWTKAEDAALTEGVNKEGDTDTNWVLIADKYLAGKRTPDQCQRRWEGVIAAGLVKGSWTPEEDKLLMACIHAGMTKWSDIAAHLPGRIGKQCRERYQNHLAPDLNRGPFTPEEDAKLLYIVAQIGTRWIEVAKQLPGRSENACKNRFNSTLRRHAMTSKPSGPPPPGVDLSNVIPLGATHTSATTAGEAAGVVKGSKKPGLAPADSKRAPHGSDKRGAGSGANVGHSMALTPGNDSAMGQAEGDAGATTGKRRSRTSAVATKPGKGAGARRLGRLSQVTMATGVAAIGHARPAHPLSSRGGGKGAAGSSWNGMGSKAVMGAEGKGDAGAVWHGSDASLPGGDGEDEDVDDWDHEGEDGARAEAEGSVAQRPATWLQLHHPHASLMHRPSDSALLARRHMRRRGDSEADGGVEGSFADAGDLSFVADVMRRGGVDPVHPVHAGMDDSGEGGTGLGMMDLDSHGGGAPTSNGAHGGGDAPNPLLFSPPGRMAGGQEHKRRGGAGMCHASTSPANGDVSLLLHNLVASTAAATPGGALVHMGTMDDMVDGRYGRTRRASTASKATVSGVSPFFARSLAATPATAHGKRRGVGAVGGGGYARTPSSALIIPSQQRLASPGDVSGLESSAHGSDLTKSGISIASANMSNELASPPPSSHANPSHANSADRLSRSTHTFSSGVGQGGADVSTGATDPDPNDTAASETLASWLGIRRSSRTRKAAHAHDDFVMHMGGSGPGSSTTRHPPTSHWAMHPPPTTSASDGVMMPPVAPGPTHASMDALMSVEGGPDRRVIHDLEPFSGPGTPVMTPVGDMTIGLLSSTSLSGRKRRPATAHLTAAEVEAMNAMWRVVPSSTSRSRAGTPKPHTGAWGVMGGSGGGGEGDGNQATMAACRGGAMPHAPSSASRSVLTPALRTLDGMMGSAARAKDSGLDEGAGNGGSVCTTLDPLVMSSRRSANRHGGGAGSSAPGVMAMPSTFSMAGDHGLAELPAVSPHLMVASGGGGGHYMGVVSQGGAGPASGAVLASRGQSLRFVDDGAGVEGEGLVLEDELHRSQLPSRTSGLIALHPHPPHGTDRAGSRPGSAHTLPPHTFTHPTSITPMQAAVGAGCGGSSSAMTMASGGDSGDRISAHSAGGGHGTGGVEAAAMPCIIIPTVPTTAILPRPVMPVAGPGVGMDGHDATWSGGGVPHPARMVRTDSVGSQCSVFQAAKVLMGHSRVPSMATAFSASLGAGNGPTLHAPPNGSGSCGSGSEDGGGSTHRSSNSSSAPADHASTAAVHSAAVDSSERDSVEALLFMAHNEVGGAHTA